MIIIKEVFITKPGLASKLAKMMKDSMIDEPGVKFRVLTDYTGRFNQVVVETEMESLAKFEERMERYHNDKALREKMMEGMEKAGIKYTEMYTSGKREIYRVM
jgi:hypothetical protein